MFFKIILKNQDISGYFISYSNFLNCFLFKNQGSYSKVLENVYIYIKGIEKIVIFRSGKVMQN